MKRDEWGFGFFITERGRIFLLYFLLLAGGLWHVLGWFQDLMRLLAGPMLMALALVTLATMTATGTSNAWKRRSWLYSLAVVVTSHYIEWYGVRSGLIFGSYNYGRILQPQVAGVPLAIGFAWLVMIWSSAAVAQRLLPQKLRRHALAFIMATAVLMVAFDAVMEPAAMKLGYWTWRGGEIPAQNYLAWFALSLAYAASGWGLRLFAEKLPALAGHVYTAQLCYFILVWIS